MSPKAKTFLIVLDGFGIGKDSPFNAIKNAKMPFYRDLSTRYPHSELVTHGHYVGLPDGVMGNSEVGHMTLGSGRVIYQDLSRISRSIEDRSFFKNQIIRTTLESGAQKSGRVHLMGLLSDGGVHSHIDHFFAALDLCAEMKIPQVAVHAFLDGRDTSPNSSPTFLTKLLAHPSFASGQARIVTVMGRYWAMDRDQRWERIDRAYQALAGKIPSFPAGPNRQERVLAAIQKSYASGKTDEFVEPVLLEPDWAMQSGDSAFFLNYRSDRAREISQVLLGLKGTPSFQLSALTGMTEYDPKVKMGVAYEKQLHKNIFGELLEARSLNQFRIAETEKYAHVTFFFNAGREKEFTGEERLLIPSPKEVATYDLKPEMSAFQVADRVADRLTHGNDSFVLVNFANADMVGHTGIYSAAVQACETIDQCLSKVIGAAEKAGFHTLLTADHGNAEEMVDEHEHAHTQHTLNPVPCIWVKPGSANAPRTDRISLQDGTLADVMPTLCEIMGLPIPQEVSGKSLLPKGSLHA